MMRQKSGRIINLASVAGLYGKVNPADVVEIVVTEEDKHNAYVEGVESALEEISETDSEISSLEKELRVAKLENEIELEKGKKTTICTYCGAKNKASDHVCSVCGAKLDDNQSRN